MAVPPPGPLHPHLQAACIYSGMTAHGGARDEIKLGRQLVFFNELFGWARIAFIALADRPPPDILYGPSPEGAIPVRCAVPLYCCTDILQTSPAVGGAALRPDLF